MSDETTKALIKYLCFSVIFVIYMIAEMAAIESISDKFLAKSFPEISLELYGFGIIAKDVVFLKCLSAISLRRATALTYTMFAGVVILPACLIFNNSVFVLPNFLCTFLTKLEYIILIIYGLLPELFCRILTGIAGIFAPGSENWAVFVMMVAFAIAVMEGILIGDALRSDGQPAVRTNPPRYMDEDSYINEEEEYGENQEFNKLFEDEQI